ncbi:MAG: class I SAM-dependent methyltransferase, partial [Pirellulaceae bacterium]
IKSLKADDMINLIKRSVARIADNPALFTLLRRILENNFRGEKKVLRRELPVPSGQSILDVGCGTGEFAPLFEAARYTGIDLHERYIAYASKRHPGYTFQVMDACQLEFPDQSFENVLVLGILHHLPEEIARQVLGEVRRILKPAGTVVIIEDVPTRSWFNLIGRLIHWLDLGSHIREQAHYQQLIEPFLQVQETCPIRSGVCDYQVFVCQPLQD